ncbi:respiratory chain complex I subunit 1 family protein [Shewanella chilikensis]|uniref:NADH-quinone oxidoreductase subunit H n=1 Tax=Shewanella chilikensis TaxID=558541 RepID=A0A6G7LXX7_9GAMM|nr:complex I subunit 1 family protein [Shewanella chilikensis]QIJ06657.1 NADH-quinone oxidoreductase subunit H [Shewanella chilikensis]
MTDVSTALDLHAVLAPLSLFPLAAAMLLLGLLLKGADRIFVARLQRRVGPPLLQPFFDIVKLMSKQSMIPHGAPKTLYLALPLVGACSMLLAVALLPIVGCYTPSAQLGDLIVLLYLLTVPAVVIMLAGSASGSTLGAIGFSREMALMLAYEGPLLLVLVGVAMKTGLAQGQLISFSLMDIVHYQQAHGAFLFDPWMWPLVLTYLSVIPANLGISPFDIPEAESEVLEGPLCEYSGPALALFKIMSTMKTMVVLTLGIVLFMPGDLTGVLALLSYLLKCSVFFLLAKGLLRAAIGRMRIDQAFLFYFKWPEALGVLGLLLVIFKG